MKTINKLGTIEAICFLLIIIVNQIIINLPKNLIINTGSSAWINIIYLAVIVILISLLVCKMFKPFQGKDIVDIAEFLGGKPLKIFVGFSYILLFVLISGIFLRYFSETLKLIYFPNSPVYFISLFFIIGIIIANKLGFRSVVLANLLIVPIVFIELFVIFISVSGKFVPERIFPILGYGINSTFFSGLSNIFAFAGFSVLYFLMPMLNKKEDFKKITIISIIFSSICLLASVLTLILVNSNITTSEELLSIYSLARTIEYGRFFQRVDAIFIFIWMLSTFSCISIILMLITNIFKKITNTTNSSAMVYCFAVLIMGLCFLPQNISQLIFLSTSIYKYFIIILVYIISLSILVGAYLKKKSIHTGGKI